ncbi:helix-turn-helix domain-containing protein [Fulvivirga lutea]|uniref:Helix-turn-helix transcriptional regulator n=1 Tax=Fulvivirga lutea TaxID=2810512 RepID=A0A974WIJ2_9BACT|nr:helix-turn-helix transcriptional regulator [Fulvivirga lutea]QSE99193.1 helix-turn-helix transcriptional regulator [Fulvivirga lutea]
MDDAEKQEWLLKLGARMKALRIQKGYTSYEPFAYEHNIPRAQYGRYERGENITFVNLMKVIQAFEMTPLEFFSEGFD